MNNMFKKPCIRDCGALHLKCYYPDIPTNIAVRCTFIYWIHGDYLKLQRGAISVGWK